MLSYDWTPAPGSSAASDPASWTVEGSSSEELDCGGQWVSSEQKHWVLLDTRRGGRPFKAAGERRNTVLLNSAERRSATVNPREGPCPRVHCQTVGAMMAEGVVRIMQQLADRGAGGQTKRSSMTVHTAEAVLSVAFSADSRWLAYGGNESFCTVRRVAGDGPARTTPKGAQVGAVLLSATGHRCISGDCAGLVVVHPNSTKAEHHR